MIHWLWALAAFVGGTIFAFIMVAFMEVSRSDDDKPKKWWEE